MKCARSVSNFTFFACGCLIVTTPFVEKILLSPLNFLCSFVKDKLTTCVWVYFWALFCSTGLFYILSLVSHQVASVLPISFFFNIVLTMLGLLCYVGFSLVVVTRLLIVVTSLAVEHELEGTQTSVVAACGLSSCGVQA